LKRVVITRLIAGLPLAGISVMHLVGAAPLKPILESAKIPIPDVSAILAAVLGMLAGLMLLSGAFARVGAAIACGSMAVALYAHLTADWPDESPIVLPIAVLAASLYVLWRGGGAWSVDGRSSKKRGRPAATCWSSSSATSAPFQCPSLTSGWPRKPRAMHR